MRTLRAHVLPLAGLLALLAASAPDAASDGARAPTLLRCAGAPAEPVRQQVGPGGANLELASGHGLGIPPRSLGNARPFEVAELQGDSVGVRIRSGNTPATFRRFAILTLSYQRCREVQDGAPIIVRIDRGGVLTPLPSHHDGEDRSVTAVLSGNSEYALAFP